MYVHSIPLRSGDKQHLERIDLAVQAWLDTLEPVDGLCLLTASHTTAGLCVTNHKDPASALDVIDEVDRLVPTRVDFHHHLDTPRDAAGHVKTALMGASLTLPVIRGRLQLGSAQGVFFAEFDGPRDREVSVYVVPSPVAVTQEAPA
jgi:secondary thiamine-phosphate synthase enzyme